METIAHTLNEQPNKLRELRKIIYKEIQRELIGRAWDVFKDKFEDLADSIEIFNYPSVNNLRTYFGN